MRYIYTNLMILAGIVCFVQSVFSETRVTYKSAKSTSSYYQMGVQIAEAIKQASSGKIIVTVEESQGSVQNVMEAGCARGIMFLPHRLFLSNLLKKEEALLKVRKTLDSMKFVHFSPFRP